MKWPVFAFLLLLAGCATGPVTQLSGRLEAGETAGSGPLVGFIADSQLQTRQAFGRVRWYRGPLEDRIVDVTLRPPALDWAARALLRTQLAQLAENGARAIFYLGDGANHGCHDEFAAGLEHPRAIRDRRVAPNDQGILSILDSFRTDTGIPVYFVLGNHDFLGAGNTSISGPRRALCGEDEAPANRALGKYEVIRLTEGFNRGNEALGAPWSYHSSFAAEGPGATERLCGEAEGQHRRWGCYLAARVDYLGSGPSIQFLLLDTNDFVDVTSSRPLGREFEGLRGAMSFGQARDGVPSQTGWFQQHAGNPVALRIALAHYDLTSLQKHVPIIGRVSSQSQEFTRLFTDGSTPRQPIQAAGYVISAHTHRRDPLAHMRRFAVRCRILYPNCAAAQRLRIAELNIGSTTDYRNYSVLARLTPDASGPGAIHYRRLNTPDAHCAAIDAEIGGRHFPNAVAGRREGWAGLGIDPRNPGNYRDFTPADLRSLFANLDQYAGTDSARSVCIALRAAAIEAGAFSPR